jgi:N-acetylneuraminate epimerase
VVVAVAAASPALTHGAGLLVVCGDDGSKLGFKPETRHPGFPHRVVRFDGSMSAWTELADAPFSRATMPSTRWRGGFVIPSGEARPGYRTPEVWTVRVK